MPPASAAPKPCERCKNPNAPYDLRNGPACRDCFVEYVEDKAGRRLGAVGRDTRPPGRPGPRRYLAGLSFGPSSTVMMQLLDSCARFYQSKKSSPAFEPLAVHVDTDLSRAADQKDGPAQRLLSKYRERFPNISFECVHLSKICAVKTLDWSALGRPDVNGPAAGDHVGRLRDFFDSLPSVTSRADILRLFVRHILLDTALERSYTALLLGHSTSALAALTFAEVANGRGFAVPWQINDGPFAVCTHDSRPAPAGRKDVRRVQMPVYYPLRELFKNEIKLYLDLVPSLKELMPEDNSTAGNVVSHKDLSITEVMERYFDAVDGPQSGIVANVVRTTGKLDRAASGSFCLMCGMTLDEQGDSRWAGELGDDVDACHVTSRAARLCYGCKRSIDG
ncbi:Thiouridylase, cytoplasmic, subunit 2 [Metarhizium album ARSEF 1941]|uniref:Cytoplasmic tRNA 2-thiolation protein 2 n=1 Tax=Metarhizium album (strain ARSEF 1941) TaxID=1081103 RepID=A0A0B2X532_METAS|nr:Thiouridylase, cytoplasmic, subunit 2 [Metarhizium album ARSEF 1941]KHO00843.1 Thiouridylase, cytoplasmic, subunit 2 [Metarhizium album ARSEF 1941]